MGSGHDRTTLRVIRSPVARPRNNMALDRALLEIEGPLTLRLYGWSPPGLSLGWFQRPDESLLDAARSRGIEVVRRLTGGGAIHHDREITYALTGHGTCEPFEGDITSSYRLVHDAILEVLRTRGLAVDYAAGAPTALKRSEQPFHCYARSTALDLVLPGGKVVGSAKRRRGDRALQHGSILLAADAMNPGAMGIEDAHGDTEGLEDAVVAAIAVALQADIEDGAPTALESARAEAIRDEAVIHPGGARATP